MFTTAGKIPGFSTVIRCSLMLQMLLVAACGPTRPAAKADPEVQARQLLAAGDFHAAAAEYRKLSGLYPQSSDAYQISAAELLLLVDDAVAAREIMQNPGTVAAGGEGLDRRRQVVMAAVELDAGNGTAAAALPAAAAPGLPVTAETLLYQTRARALVADNAIESVRLRVRMFSLSLPESYRDRAATAMWTDLQQVAPDDLRKLGADIDSDLGSWAELALIWQSMRSRQAALGDALQRWIGSHPDHPAIPVVTSRLLADAGKLTRLPGHIALLLPLTGQYAQAARATRDGFIAALYQYPGEHARISVLDADALNIVEQYRRAVAAGADMVVGPLEKNAVKVLFESGEISVNTLALNHTDPGPADSARAGSLTYPVSLQFGLSPEDEAAQAAQRAFFDGHTRAIVIAPDSEWGQRLSQSFADEWQTLGGTMLERVMYNPGETDFSGIVREAFNIDSSDVRGALLRQRIGYALHIVARLRDDADMVFMPAQPVIARQLVPQFRYFGADGVPVYATSSVFDGDHNQRVDADLDGVLFPDINWITRRGEPASPVQQAITGTWPDEMQNLQRLYALGADAFLLTTVLGELGDSTAIRGETGMLYLYGNRNVHRRLSWARVRAGSAVPVDSPAAP